MNREELKKLIFDDAFSSGRSNIPVMTGGTGVSIDSPLVPIFAGKDGTVMTFAGIQGKVVIYSLAKSSNYSSHIYRNRDFTELFRNTMVYKYFQITSRYITNGEYWGVKGCVFQLVDSVPEIMFTLAIERDHFHTLTKDTFDFSKLVIVVNNKLLLPEHKYIYGKLKLTFVALKLSILYTDDPNQWCFGNHYQLPFFATLADRMEYLSNIKNFI